MAIRGAVNNLADKMGIDPAELRQKNLIAQGEQSLVYRPDEYLDSGLFQDTVNRVKEMARWDERPSFLGYRTNVIAAESWHGISVTRFWRC